MAKIVSMDTIQQEKRQGTFEKRVPFVINGEQHNVVTKMVNGVMNVYDLQKPIGEMLTTASTQKELLEKVVLDVELGKEATPTLYAPIYERLEDRNFPEVFDAKWAQRGVVVFLEHFEGGEIRFGNLQAEEGPIARIKTYAAGFEYTEDMQEYNRTFELAELNRAFGEAYNALLNHIHLSPIFNFAYGNDNKTAKVLLDAEGKPATNEASAHPILSLRATLRKGIADARVARRPGNVLLISGDRLDHVNDALGALHVRGTDFPALTGIDTIIAYDGWSTQVGQKFYDYDGVPTNKAFLIRPKRGFKELIKHGLLIDANMGDLSRLVEAQVVGRTRRGVFAALTENVQEIELPF